MFQTDFDVPKCCGNSGLTLKRLMLVVIISFTTCTFSSHLPCKFKILRGSQCGES